MFDKVTRTEHKGFISRLVSSFVGVLIGLLMVPGSCLLIAWNEYRTIHRTQGLIQAEKVVAEMPSPFEPAPELEGRLVHVSGNATTEEFLQDGQFDLGRKALRMERIVEMYQWVERKDSKTRDKLGGGKETVTTYEYNKKWHRDRVNSEAFEQPSGHSNPHPRYDSTSLYTTQAMLGVFHLRSDLITQLNSWRDVPLEESVLLSKLNATEKSHHKVDGAYLYYSPETPSASEPKVGDIRIQFRMVEPMTVSLLSKPKGTEFEPFKTGNGETVESIAAGQLTAVEMFNSLKFENTALATILRLLGWFLACLGFGMIAGPLHAFANVVPIFGKMVGGATMLIAFILGSVLALLTIGVAWVAVRPLYSLALVAIASVGIYFMFRRKKTEEPPMAVLVD